MGWLVHNAWLNWPVFDRQFGLLEDAARARGLTLDRVTNAHAQLADAPSFALAFDKDVALLRLLEARGTRVFNSAAAVETCDSKALTYPALLAAGVPQPDTLLVPLRFAPQTAWGKYADAAIDTLGLPLVAKRARSSWGAGVELVESRAGLLDFLCGLGTEDAVLQRFIAAATGTDARLYFVGDDLVAAMIRRSSGDFRANIAAGGTAEAFAPDAATIAAARGAMGATGLDFGGIDVLFDADGAPLICEVNSNAQFVALTEITGVDVAGAILDHVAAQIN